MPILLRPLILLLIAAAAATAFGSVGVGSAQASACSSALIRDWYVDGRIDKTYPVHCYREALKEIPEDQLIYGTLRDDLNRALQDVIRKNNGDVGPMTPVPPRGGGGGGTGGATGGKHSGGFFHWVANKIGPNTADSVPIPLLVLGGLALALIAAAGISFFARRVQAKRASDPPPHGPLP
jgi:hypothetical protein